MDVSRSSLKLFGARVGSAAFLYAGVTVFARELGAAAMGVFFLFQALLGLGKLPADLGVRDAAAKRISEGQPAGTVLTTAALLKAVPLAVVTVVVVATRGPLASYVGADLAWLLVAALALQAAGGLLVKVLTGELRVGETAVVRMAQDVVWAVGGAVLVFGAGLGARGLVYALLAGYAAKFGWAALRVRTVPARPSVATARSLLEYSKYNAVSAAGMNLYGWVDVAIIGLLLAQADVGAYEVAWRVAGVTVLLTKAISVSIFPEVSRLDAAGDTRAVADLVSASLVPSLFLVIPAVFGGLLFAPEILGLVFGAEYAVAALALVVLLAQKVFVAVRRVLYRSLKAIDRPDLAARATVASVATNVALNFLLVWAFGLVGAAVATTLAFALDTALHVRYVSQYLPLTLPTREVGWLVASGAAMATLLAALDRVLVVDSLPELGAVVALGAVAYVAVALTAPSLRGQVVGQVRALVPR